MRYDVLSRFTQNTRGREGRPGWVVQYLFRRIQWSVKIVRGTASLTLGMWQARQSFRGLTGQGDPVRPETAAGSRVADGPVTS